MKDEINEVFTQLVVMLADKGYISLDVEYIDGTKIESKANKYTFVWRKSTEKNRAKLMEKIKVLLEQVDDSIAQENGNEDEPLCFTPSDLRDMAERLNKTLEATPEPSTKEDKEKRKEERQQVRQLRQHADKLEEYDRKLETLGKRNSYSKTDKDATFMRMKEDAMMNGQTKPGYNLQIGTENQFILDFGLFQTPGDPLTMIPFLKSCHERYGRLPSTVVADSGYGSEENYHFMDRAGIEAYVKYNRFHIEQRMHYEPDPFSQQALYYNADEDYYVCPMGQHMVRIGTSRERTESGYVAEKARYRAQRCDGCPLRCRCFRSKGNRIIEVNHSLAKYRKQAAERLTSEEGIKYRGKRCIEPEAVFGQMKYDMNYKRFRHFGMDKVKMDFAFFAIAFNIKKMCSKINKKGKGKPFGAANTAYFCLLAVLTTIETTKNGILTKKSA